MESISGKIILKKGKQKPVKNRHPWIFSGAISRVEGNPQPGDYVAIHDYHDDYLAIGYYNPASQIRVRILSWKEQSSIGESFWRSRMMQAIEGRSLLFADKATDAFRLINAESDRLPGLIVDRYGEHLVVQCLTLGIARRKDLIAQQLDDLIKPTGVYERSDSAVTKKENLPLVKGPMKGNPPEGELIIRENGLQFIVDIRHGHKTGFYLDQRRNRMLLQRPDLVAGKSLLNVFAYTGGFSVYAASAKAGSITNIDSSIPALELAERNMKLNGFERPSDEYLAGDAFEVLRHYRDHEQKFDIVVLDPPKFAHSKRNLNRASRGYKDLNLLGLHLLNAGGLLLTFSCSGLVSEDLFQKILFAATIDAGREVQIIQRLYQSSDHPVSITFPESSYLKGFLCRVW